MVRHAYPPEDGDPFSKPRSHRLVDCLAHRTVAVKTVKSWIKAKHQLEAFDDEEP